MKPFVLVAALLALPVLAPAQDSLLDTYKQIQCRVR